MIPYRFRFVKNFFQFFQTFFVPSSKALRQASSAARERLDYFTISGSSCQELFSNSFDFFLPDAAPAPPPNAPGFSQTPGAARLSLERSLILADYSPVVNSFFPFFLSFFDGAKYAVLFSVPAQDMPLISGPSSPLPPAPPAAGQSPAPLPPAEGAS